MSILVNANEHGDEISKAHRRVAKSLAGEAGNLAGQAVRGAKRGLKLAGQGHTPLGQIGSGVAGRPTYSIRPGMSPAGRAGIHAGVIAGNAPTAAAGGALGAAVGAHEANTRKIGKSAFGVELGKAKSFIPLQSVGRPSANTPEPRDGAAVAAKIRRNLQPAKKALLASMRAK